MYLDPSQWKTIIVTSFLITILFSILFVYYDELGKERTVKVFFWLLIMGCICILVLTFIREILATNGDFISAIGFTLLAIVGLLAFVGGIGNWLGRLAIILFIRKGRRRAPAIKISDDKDKSFTRKVQSPNLKENWEKGSQEKRNQPIYEENFKEKNDREKPTSALIEPKWRFKSNNNINTIEPTHYPYVIMPVENSTIQLPEVGRSGIKGFTERKFKNYLHEFFGSSFKVEDNLIIPLKNQTCQYEPDFTLIYAKDDINIYLDIEIDEPYEGKNDLINRKALHYIGTDDERDVTLAKSGWLTIRFAEIQIHQNPRGCCKFIGEVLDGIYDHFKFYKSFNEISDLENFKGWSKLKAEDWSLQKYREEYLGIKKFGSWEINDNISTKPYTESISIFSDIIENGIGIKKIKGIKTYSSNGKLFELLQIQLVVNGDKKENLLPYLEDDILEKGSSGYTRDEIALKNIVNSFAEVIGRNSDNKNLQNEFTAKIFTQDHPLIIVEVVNLIMRLNFAYQTIYRFHANPKMVKIESGMYMNEGYLKLYEEITDDHLDED